MNDVVWQALVLILIAIVGLETFLLVAVMRQVGNLMIMINPTDPRAIAGGPAVGSEIEEPPGIALPAVLVFVAPNCDPCVDLAPTFPILRAKWPEVSLVPVVSNADDEELIEHALALGGGARGDLPELYKDWGVPGTPFAVAVDAERIVRRTGVTNTLDQLETLAAAALAPAPEPPEPRLEIEREEMVV